MPYITQQRRFEIDDLGDFPENAGELNYRITETIYLYFKNKGGRYQQINDVLGALEGAKLEFYRRVAVPYEQEKIKLNGDVY